MSITISQSLLKLRSIESVISSKLLILCCPFLLLPSIIPSIRVFPNESVLHIRWPKYWSFSFSISPSSEFSGLFSFRMDWLHLLVSPRDSQECSPTPQFKSINSSVLSFPYCPTLTSIHDYWKNPTLVVLKYCSFISCLGKSVPHLSPFGCAREAFNPTASNSLLVTKVR